MANLTFSEKNLIETVFGMGGGYVLEFSNREFGEFMKDVVQYDIYEKYPGLSKAKMLREFLQDESEVYVGKLIISLINFMKDEGLVKDDIKEKTNKLYDIGKRLLGKSSNTMKQDYKTPKPVVNYNALKDSLLDIEKLSSAQAKGYEFEKYLNRLFGAFELEPNASYRTEHDQLDGSFTFEGNTILIEAKYKSKEIPKDDLILFENKLKSKSHFTKGLFITYSSVTSKALAYFQDSGSRIVVLTVEEIFLMCQDKTSLVTLLKNKYRLLDERGLIFKHYLELNMN